jgi:hypothetical protein
VPTVFVLDGYRVQVYTRNEHQPPHVHVERAQTSIPVLIGEEVRWRGDWDGRRPTDRELRRGVEIVGSRLADCLAMWNRYHAWTNRHPDRR